MEALKFENGPFLKLSIINHKVQGVGQLRIQKYVFFFMKACQDIYLYCVHTVQNRVNCTQKSQHCVVSEYTV